MTIRPFLLSTIIPLAIACSPKVTGVTGDADVKKDIDRSNYKVERTISDTLFFISEGVCFGKCPVYEATIYNNGIVVYKGTENVERIGLFYAHLSQAQLDGLIDTILAVDYFDMPATFPTVPTRLADLPTTYTMAELNDKRHVITNLNYEDHNKKEAHDKWLTLKRFEDHVYELLSTLAYNRIEQLKTED